MGKIININPKIAKPSQDFLRKDTLEFIKNNYDNSNFEKLPPIPILRKQNDDYIVIDGHNLLAFYFIKGFNCNVYVADNKEDVILGDSEMINKRNRDLYEKYDLALEQAKFLSNARINNIEDLCYANNINL
jgi:hypothetical protein